MLFLLSFLLQILALQEKNRECERRLEESQQQLEVLRRESQQMKSEAMLKTSQVRCRNWDFFENISLFYISWFFVF